MDFKFAEKWGAPEMGADLVTSRRAELDQKHVRELGAGVVPTRRPAAELDNGHAGELGRRRSLPT